MRGVTISARAAIAFVGVALLLPVAGVLGAHEAWEQTDEPSAADQYVESIPTSRGPRAPELTRERTGALPAEVARRLERGGAGGRLEEIATSSRLGAPQRKLKGGRDRVEAPRAPSAVVGALDDGAAPIGLVIGFIALAAAAFGTVRHRRRGHSS
jgi:hypothetical protein